MDRKYLDKVYGKKIAKENITLKISKLSKSKENITEITNLMIDLEEIEKGNIEIIQKYIGENSGK